tara:strand:+ start:1093 stop:1488 length:396 start_codon:yes stop_codon:yes gene_type:complete
MITKIKKNFLVINCIGKNDNIGLYVNNKFFTKKIQNNILSYELLVSNLLNFLKENKTKINKDFLILINLGPGSFSALRIALSVAKGIKIVSGAKIGGYKNSQLHEFNLENLEKLITKNSLEYNLINPIYLS